MRQTRIDAAWRRRVLAAAATATAGIVVPSPVSQAAVPTTIRVSVSSLGAQAHRAVTLPAQGISDDGRDVLLTSTARLVAGDTNGVSDAYLRDAIAGTTERMSVSSSGRHGNGSSVADALSPDGRYVLFTSAASDLSVGADTNGVRDVFLRDRRLGITRRVSIPPAGDQFRGPSVGVAVSANGRFVLFTRRPLHAGGRVYLRDRLRGTTTRIGRKFAKWDVGGAGLSANGRMLAYVRSGEKTGTCNVVIHDRATGRTTDTSGLRGWSYGCCGGPVLFTPDGGKAVFACPTDLGSGPLAVVLWTPGSFTPLTGQDGDSLATGISDDGNQVSFVSDSTGLVSGDTNGALDLFSMDLTTQAITRLDLSATGAQIAAGVPGFGGDKARYTGALSGDGRWAAFDSQGGSVVAGDTNGIVDVFLRGPLS
ncbi:MAG: hypothetical protein ACXVPL_11290 [Actinomycetota bacterium]